MNKTAVKVGCGLAVAACAVCGIGGFILFRMGVGKVTEIVGQEYPEPQRFVAAMNAGRLDEAYAMTTSGYQSRVTRAAFKSRTDAYREQLAGLDMAKPTSFNLRAESGSPNRTDLTYGNADQSKLVRFTLLEGTGGSKIDAITRVK